MTGASDVISIRSDLTNRIPDKSWMLYLLELFDAAGTPVELNLIAQFNNLDNFWAIFGGVNRYKFTSVLPNVGHSYLRKIEFHPEGRLIKYILQDQVSAESEVFEFPVPSQFSFYCSAQFTGVEWWNRISDNAFPIRYQAEISSISYQTNTWRKYDSLVPDYDRPDMTYPVEYKPSMRDGSIAYTVSNGSTLGGLSLLATRT